MFITIGIKIPENEFLEPNSVRSHSNYNIMENKVGHHDFLGYASPSPIQCWNFKVRCNEMPRNYGDTHSSRLERVRMLSCLVYFAPDCSLSTISHCTNIKCLESNYQS